MKTGDIVGFKRATRGVLPDGSELEIEAGDIGQIIDVLDEFPPCVVVATRGLDLVRVSPFVLVMKTAG